MESDGSYPECLKCRVKPEEYKCIECGLTGKEIYIARFEFKYGISHISKHLESLSEWEQ